MTDQVLIWSIFEKLVSSSRESSTVEFKSNLDNPEEIGEYLSAMANTAALDAHDRAWIVWGVEDGALSVIGTKFDPFSRKIGNQALTMWLQQKTSPRADFQFHRLDYAGNQVVLLEIHPARSAPIAFQNIRYIRIDSHKTKLSEHPDKEARLWARMDQKDDWTGTVIPDASLEDLDPVAVEMARRRFTEYLLKSEQDPVRQELIKEDSARWSVETLLNKARLTKQGRITRAALLLLGKDESSHFLSPADVKISWILRDQNNRTVGSHPYGIPFLLSTDKVYGQIRNVTVEYMPDQTLFPHPIAKYDPWVIREALHNCIAHQDYRLGAKINLVEHPDRLVFTNLGQFIPPSVEWMLEHHSPPEHYRNQWLIDGMIRLRMIEQVGSGIRRMFETQRDRFFPLPDYSFAPTEQGYPRVELSISGQILDIKYTQILMKRSDLTLRQVLLLDQVQKKRPIVPEEVRELKSLGLLEGRAPNYHISAKVADWTGQKASYLRHRGLDDKHYQELVIHYLKKYGTATRRDIDELLLPKLPEVLDFDQKSNKIKNLLQTLRRQQLIVPSGPRSATVWALASQSDQSERS